MRIGGFERRVAGPLEMGIKQLSKLLKENSGKGIRERPLTYYSSKKVAIDASIVRALLVPATMKLLGHWNWWIPGWLDRILPSIDVGEH